MNDDILWLQVEVPIASFGIPTAREFGESYPFPPPATVYGMLLSYVGETDRLKYRGTGICIRMKGLPGTSIVLRKIRRFKNAEMASKDNSKPDYSMLLSHVSFLVGVRDSKEGGHSLTNRLREAFQSGSKTTERFGGLSCGESHHLVDVLKPLDQDFDGAESDREWWALRLAEEGEWAVPVWVDHVGSAGTVWKEATLETANAFSLLSTTTNDFFDISPIQASG